ncbi:uncharacterized protein LOC143298791 [Babylonia areolata]|uniref:uncharacterized protein LOC143298791 n=1 Tax=Babylonia areolata TaxID=304850 RepID=UPI003FCF69F6
MMTTPTTTTTNITTTTTSSKRHPSQVLLAAASTSSSSPSFSTSSSSPSFSTSSNCPSSSSSSFSLSFSSPSFPSSSPSSSSSGLMLQQLKQPVPPPPPPPSPPTATTVTAAASSHHHHHHHHGRRQRQTFNASTTTTTTTTTTTSPSTDTATTTTRRRVLHCCCSRLRLLQLFLWVVGVMGVTSASGAQGALESNSLHGNQPQPQPQHQAQHQPQHQRQQQGCQHNLQYTTANCSGRGLDRVPWGLHHNLDTLDLCHNRFTSLEPNAFKSYSNLRVLRLCHNNIRTLHPDSLAKLTHIHSLDLSGNLMTAIPTEVLNTLPTLLRLDLSGNNLVTVPDEAFRGLRNLKVLDLSANRITDIEPNALMGLHNLQVLRLENNAVRWLAPRLFQHLSDQMLQLHLYGNPWLCDCKVRYMRQWMANGTSAVWQQPGHTVRCEGPSISRGKALSSIPLDELACRVEMRTSGSTKTVSRGQEVMMECIYFSMPPATPIWQRNQMPINFAADPAKYRMTVEGSPVTVTRLYVRDFQYTDIMEYECLAHNIRGSDSTVFKVTLKGVPFDSVSHNPPASTGASLGLNSKSIVVGVAVVCGLILVTVFSLLIYYCVRHFRQQEQEKQDAVVESVKKHFLTSEEMATMDSRGGGGDGSKLDQFHETSLDTARAKEKASAQGSKQPGGPHEREPLYTFQQHGSPVASGNTYVSFSTEVIEPEVYPMYPQTRTSLYEESQAESKTPLLNRGTPSAASDADESVDDSLHSHVYESISVYRARRSQCSVADPTTATTPTTSTPTTTTKTGGGSSSQSRGSSHSTPVSRTSTTTTNHPDYQDYREIGHLGHHAKVPKKDVVPAPKKSGGGGKSGGSTPVSGVGEARGSPGTATGKEFIEMLPQDSTGSGGGGGSTVPHVSGEGQQ